MSDHTHAPIVRSLDGDQGHKDPHAVTMDHDEHGHDDHGGLTKYYLVFVALCVLTAASFFTYSSAWPWHATPQIGWAFMMAVSCTKAMLVILFFMHVLYEANWKYVLTIPAGMMSIFLILMLIPDVGMRGRHAAEERQQRMAYPRDERPHAEGNSAHAAPAAASHK